MGNEFIEGIHYYLDGNKVIFTERYHIERGYCCESSGNGCRHCPYEPKGEKGNTLLKKGLDDSLKD
jgi:hypothetical protein